MAITIIALIIALLSLGLGLSVLREGRKESRELDGIIADLKKEKEQSHPVAVNTSFGEGVTTYDIKSGTVTVKANLKVEGYVSAGEKEE